MNCEFGQRIHLCERVTGHAKYLDILMSDPPENKWLRLYSQGEQSPLISDCEQVAKLAHVGAAANWRRTAQHNGPQWPMRTPNLDTPHN